MGLLIDIDTLHLDRSYDLPAVRDRLRAALERRGHQHLVVELQQLRRNTDRRTRHRHAALCTAIIVLIVGRLIDWRNRWTPT